MDWKNKGVAMLRVLVNDIDGATYTNHRLQHVILVAGVLVLTELEFATSYEINIGAQTLSPDPTSNEDDAFFGLMILKAACIIDQSEYRTKAGQSISVSDARSSIKADGLAGAYKVILEIGACKAYEEAKRAYQLGAFSGSGVGRAIMTPIATGFSHRTVYRGDDV